MKRRAMIAVCVGLLLVLSAGALLAEGLTSNDLVAEAKKSIKEASVDQVKGFLDKGGYVFIDVREPDETKMGFIPSANLIPRGLLEFRIEPTVADKNAKIVVYCKSGGRSALAAYTLGRMGYANVLSMAGGFTAWTNAGYKIAE